MDNTPIFQRILRQTDILTNFLETNVWWSQGQYNKLTRNHPLTCVKMVIIEWFGYQIILERRALTGPSGYTKVSLPIPLILTT